VIELKTVWNIPLRSDVGKPMRFDSLSVNRENTVAILIHAPEPQMAITASVNERFKSFNVSHVSTPASIGSGRSPLDALSCKP
jgi:hypothetical protein